ncbi:signal transduction histidine kinase [Rhizobium leguminosarum bv. trifolii WSM597]|uniref:histidine kinase n=1 Tax=Rhizobium leguminosarum bv. trifolii WSM597 TaxID=754764 RepID=I9XDB3_RHILT|nr:sensor histidine kinase [Rhizobium leguminosarum]EJB07066.1 signal transduction histidine kinase [Rhizobium leguminosarum bv. trifolii WSM597]
MTDAPESELDWVLVLAPFRKDSDYIAAFLREQRVAVKAAKLDDDLELLLGQSPGIIAITHEALSASVVDRIGKHLVEQPDWSEVPIIVLLERSASISRIRNHLEHAWPGARLLFHTRPIKPLELVNAIQSNLLVRLRQRQVRDSIERERELRLELNHRVKNILASVTSIFQMTRRGAATVEDLSADFSSRLQALADVHSAVFEAGGEEVSFSAVVELTVSPYRSSGISRIAAHGPELVVNRDAATTIALCLHELITNAIKYGALSQAAGTVDLTWALDDSETGGRFLMSWVETGGPGVREPTRQGYGTRYIRSALGSLFGSPPEMTYAPAGFRCQATGPLSRITPADART